MRFEHNPQLFLTEDEFDVLDGALKLCRDMDCETGANACENCPFQDDCTHMCSGCVYEIAHRALKKIIDTAIVK